MREATQKVKTNNELLLSYYWETTESCVKSWINKILIEVRKMKFRLLILASIAAFIAVANPESVQEVFDPHSGEESYQRRYVISVLNKAEDCYYIPEVRTNQIINFHFVVSLLFFSASSSCSRFYIFLFLVVLLLYNFSRDLIILHDWSLSNL